MLILCDQCHSKYKITIKKAPTKPVNFRCGKCQKTIVISPEELAQDLSPALPPETTAPPPAPEPAAAAPPATETSATDTVQLSCLKCGTAFVKHQDDKARLCYQCRIDAIVSKIKDKYGVTDEVELPEVKSKYTFRSLDGLLLGPIKLKTVAVLVREKRLKGKEEVSKDGGDFRPWAEFEELRKLFPDLFPSEPSPPPAEKPVHEHEEEIPLDLDEEPLKPKAVVKPPQPAPAKPAAAPPPPRPAKPLPTPSAAPPTPPARTSAASENVPRYKIRYPDGLVLGPVRLISVEDLVAAGNLTGQEEVQKDKGPWKPFLDYPELKSLVASGEEIGEDEIVELTDLLEEAG